jgi:small subunit ribosomal protein S20
MAEAEKKVKERRPQALKRDIQNEKRRLHNRAFRSKTSTAIRALEAAITSGGSAQERLNAVYSLVDKGVKTGMFKQNKANRVKARLTKRVKTSTK